MADRNKVTVAVNTHRQVTVQVGTSREHKTATLSHADTVRLQKELARAAQEQ